MFGYGYQNFFLADIVQSYKDSSMLVEIEEVLNKGLHHFNGVLLWREIELCLEESIVQVKHIYLFGTALETLVEEVRGVEVSEPSKKTFLESDVSGVEDAAHVPFYEHHHCSNTVVGIEECYSNFEGAGHLQRGGLVDGENILHRVMGTRQVRLG